MRRYRRGVRTARWIPVLALLVAGCGGPSQTEVRGITQERSSAAERAAGTDLRRAQMGAGTNWMPGALSSFCDAGRCASEPSAAPGRFLKAPDDGLLVFVVARRPTDASLTVTKASGKPVYVRALSPSTAMAVEAGLGPGRYIAELTATWDRRVARWVFGVRV